MPFFRGISLSLHSQFGIMTIPEYSSPIPYHSSSSTSDLATPPERITDVYIPLYALSQFWLSYRICCSDSAKHGNLDDIGDLAQLGEAKFLYFQLWVNGVRTVEWGLRCSEGAAGKTVFAVADSEAGSGLVKRGFFFQGSEDDGEDEEVDCEEEEGGLEIRVFRARGRRRIKVKGRRDGIGGWEGGERGGVYLQTIGRMKKEDPKRFYEYALVDAKDEPWAVFRYHVCTVDQLLALGIVPGPRQEEENKFASGCGELVDHTAEEDAVEGASILNESDTTTDDGGQAVLDPVIVQRITECTALARRVSILPSSQSNLTIESPQPLSPTKSSTEAVRYSSEEFPNHIGQSEMTGPNPVSQARTPSPAHTFESRSTTYSLDEYQNARPGTMSVLKGVLGSALRRKMSTRSSYASPVPVSGSSQGSYRIDDGQNSATEEAGWP